MRNEKKQEVERNMNIEDKDKQMKGRKTSIYDSRVGGDRQREKKRIGET